MAAIVLCALVILGTLNAGTFSQGQLDRARPLFPELAESKAEPEDSSVAPIRNDHDLRVMVCSRSPTFIFSIDVRRARLSWEIFSISVTPD